MAISCGGKHFGGGNNGTLINSSECKYNQIEEPTAPIQGELWHNIYEGKIYIWV